MEEITHRIDSHRVGRGYCFRISRKTPYTFNLEGDLHPTYIVSTTPPYELVLCMKLSGLWMHKYQVAVYYRRRSTQPES